jgi:hypothetical protein
MHQGIVFKTANNGKQVRRMARPHSGIGLPEQLVPVRHFERL